MREGDFEWACFSAQQSAQMALKALFQHLGEEAFGHSVLKLLKDLPRKLKSPEALLSTAADLDKLYIPTRDPNGFPEGAPMDYFNKKDADSAVENAAAVLAYAKSKISE